MAGTKKRIAGPAYIANAAANIYTPPASTIETQINLIHVANVTGAPATVTLYIGGTGGSTGGTELCKGKVVPANDFIIIPCAGRVMASTDFLTGVASAASTLVITIDGEQRVI